MKGWTCDTKAIPHGRRVTEIDLTSQQRRVVISGLLWLTGEQPMMGIARAGRGAGKTAIIETLREYDRRGHSFIKEALAKEGY